MTEQRYQAVLAVISEGLAVMEVASQRGVSRRTVHRWSARYEAQGLEGLPDRSHRPERCPHQMPAEIEVRVLELRRAHRYWGARRLALEFARKKVTPAPSESAVYRCLVRAGVITSTEVRLRQIDRRCSGAPDRGPALGRRRLRGHRPCHRLQRLSLRLHADQDLDDDGADHQPGTDVVAN